MGNHFTDPIYWFQVLLGLLFYVAWRITELIGGGPKTRLFESFGKWRFWPAFTGLSAGGVSSAALDVEPTIAVGMGALAYLLTGMNPKAGKDEPWLAKNSD